MKTGFIGLGAMGVGMSRNLHQAGYLTQVWNRTAAKAAAVHTELGVAVANSPADLAAAFDPARLGHGTTRLDPALLATLGHRPNRQLGQNFLVDGNIVRKSLELAGVAARHRRDFSDPPQTPQPR